MTDQKQFNQTWWSENIPHRLSDFKMWVGDPYRQTKIYSRNHIQQKGYKSILDVGCGDCTMLTGFQNDGYDIKYTGLDSCKFFIDKNRESGITMIGADVQNTGLPDSSYDIVFSRHVIEHQPTFGPLLQETIRLAKCEALHVFFIPPGEEEKINYTANDNLYHNKYRKSDIEKELLANKKVKQFYWKIVDAEEVLHIDMKN